MCIAVVTLSRLVSSEDFMFNFVVEVDMTLRRRLRSIITTIKWPLPSGGAVDHPSDGGITGEEYPEDNSHCE